MAVAIDHIILAVDDLEAGASRLLAATGLAAVPGGAHPDWGTANVIVPLGAGYLELVTVVDREVAAGSAFGRRVAEGDGLAAWAVSVDDLDAVATRLDLEIRRGRRTLADGTTLSWAMAGVDEALERGLPFFLRWDDAAANPARAAAPHRVEPRGIRWIEVPGASRDALDAWLGPHDLDLRAVDGPLRAGIAVGGDEVVIP